MKKNTLNTTSLLIIIFIIIFPLFFSFKNRVSAATGWYYTKTNTLLLGKQQPGAVSFVNSSTEEECNTKLGLESNNPSTYITLSLCKNNILSTGDGFSYNVTMTTKQFAENNPVGFPSEEECNVNRDNFLKSSVYLDNKINYVEISACAFKKNIITGVVVVNPDNSAPAPNGGVYTLLAPIGDLTTAPDNMGDYFNTIFTLAIGLCGVLAVIMIVIGGVQYMGDESIFGKTEAKSRITSAVLGLLIALGSYALLNTINPDLLGKGGIKINSVSAGIDDTPIVVESSIPATGVAVGTKGLCPGGLSPVVIGGATIMNTCVSITSKITSLINTATSQGIALGGKSYRSNADQITLRIKNCKDPLTTPSEQCTPPTAKAGNSKHESGLAIDFTCNGTIINIAKTPATKKCFDWLVSNAGTIAGLVNLPSENWHWST